MSSPPRSPQSTETSASHEQSQLVDCERVDLESYTSQLCAMLNETEEQQACQSLVQESTTKVVITISARRIPLRRSAKKKVPRRPADNGTEPSRRALPAKPTTLHAGAKTLVKLKPSPKPQEGSEGMSQTASTSCGGPPGQS
ncbi:hypothetical protein BC629DRAFT_1598142 [Irpex lacteus]|nr:hypothetical protein BC629DRAFT_1598142 [Irpex lacteus]